MPRYHFNTHDGQVSIDELGTELPDEMAARYEAIRMAGKILDDDKRRLATGGDWFMEVTDRHGLVLFRLDFHVTGSPVLNYKP